MRTYERTAKLNSCIIHREVLIIFVPLVISAKFGRHCLVHVINFQDHMQKSGFDIYYQWKSLIFYKSKHRTNKYVQKKKKKKKKEY